MESKEAELFPFQTLTIKPEDLQGESATMDDAGQREKGQEESQSQVSALSGGGAVARIPVDQVMEAVAAGTIRALQVNKGMFLEESSFERIILTMGGMLELVRAGGLGKQLGGGGGPGG
jgi:hypothetical protein